MNLFILIVAAVSIGLFGITPATPEAISGPERPQATINSLQAEIDALRTELRQLRAESRHQRSWIDQAEQEEVRDLIEQVLADTSTRQNFQDAGLGVGYDGKNFYLEGQGFRLAISGHIQARHVVNTANRADTEAGFELRRTKVQFAGHVADPKLSYVIRLADSRSSGNAYLEEARIGYKFDQGTELRVGKMKLPFLRQELLSSTRQLAIDRGIGTEYFTLNFAEQIQAIIPLSPSLKTTLAYSDGGNSESTASLSGTVEYALTGRADWLLQGEWSDLKDLRPRKDEQNALALGVAVHAQSAEGSDSHTLAWTADALFKTGRWSGMLAYMGGQDSATDIHVHGLTAETGVAITEKTQPFARYDFILEESANPLQAVTLGVNHYLRGHQAKVTADVVWVFEADTPNTISGLNSAPLNSGLGLTASGDEQVATRVQFQLLF